MWQWIVVDNCANLYIYIYIYIYLKTTNLYWIAWLFLFYNLFLKGKDSGAKQGIIKRVILVKEVEEEYEKLKNSLMMKKKLSSKPLKKKVWNFTVKSKLFKRALIGWLINPHISVSICRSTVYYVPKKEAMEKCRNC